MVEQYNDMALKGGFSPEKVKAVQGDLVDPESTPSPELNSPEFFNFDLIIMCMALHHVQDHEKMIEKLSERLREGGVLIIVDWVAISESNCPDAPQAKALSNQTMTRMGFTEQDVKGAYEKSWSGGLGLEVGFDEVPGTKGDWGRTAAVLLPWTKTSSVKHSLASGVILIHDIG